MTNYPLKISGVDNINYIKIATGFFHSVALDNESNVWTWGDNRFW